MAEETLANTVMQIVAKQFDQQQVNPEDDVARAYGAKSHDMIQLSAALQAQFGIKITYIQSRGCKTVQDWINMVEKLVGEAT
ncbi:acyl carrier protein [Eubacteriales bacterium OttesenSCG-928-N14]|nr:acyl carrier protein [Eubacteriales bacterium OttesenSCG-928-N14]